jgi:hypothetical protein
VSGRVVCLDKCGLIIVTMLCLLTSVAGGQTVQPQVIADSFYTAGMYDEAITEYKRQLFFSPETEEKSLIYRRLGLCYRNLNNWNEAFSMLRMAIDRQGDDSLRAELEIDLAVTGIAFGKYSSASLGLTKLSSFARQPKIRQEATFFLMICAVYRGDWKRCRQLLDSTSRSGNSLATESVSRLIERESQRKKSPSKAKWLSTFLPGSGQVYAGHYWAAANSLGLNGLVSSEVLHLIHTEAGVLDVVAWLFTLERFWSGGRSRAARFVMDGNRQVDSVIRGEVLDSIRVQER